MVRISIRQICVLSSVIILSMTLGACDNGEATPDDSGDVGDIRVEKAEAIRTIVGTEEFPLPNCGGTTNLSQSLGTQTTVKKGVTIGAKATTSAGGEVEIPELVRLKLEAQVELSYQQTYETASSRLDTIHMGAAPGTHVVYVVQWEEQKFASTVSYAIRGKVYKAPYIYMLRIPKISDSYQPSCPSLPSTPTETSGPPTPTNTATPTKIPTSTDTPTSTPMPTNTPTPTNTSTNTPTATNTPTPTNTATPTPSTSSLPFMVDESGWVTRSGQVGTGVDHPPQAGDFNNNATVRGFLSFDLTGIPGNATIQSAKLILPELPQELGDLFPKFGSLKFEAVWYGLSLHPNAFDSPAYMVLQNAYGEPSPVIGVTAGLDEAIQQAYKRFQIRFSFSLGTDNDNSGEVYWVPVHVEGGTPGLEVVFTLP